jgi:hypothetical protein
MLLHALEVPEALIRGDYLASRAWPGADSHPASLQERLGAFIPPEELAAAVDTVLDVRDVYLDAAMDAVVQQCGSVLRYLEAAASLDSTRLEALRKSLLA